MEKQSHRPRVFVVHLHHELDTATGQLVPKHNVSRAQEFGEIVHLLPPNANPLNKPDECIDAIHEGLADIRPTDWLLLVGSPVLIGWACAVAADILDGHLPLLQWSGTHRRYLPIKEQVLEPMEHLPLPSHPSAVMVGV